MPNSHGLRKADPALRDALSQAGGAETLTAIMTLGPEPAGSSGGYPLGQPAHLSRQELINQRKAQVAKAIGPTLKHLADLNLQLSGAKMTPVAVVTGTATQIEQALELDGVRSAMLDRPMELIAPKNSTY